MNTSNEVTLEHSEAIRQAHELVDREGDLIVLSVTDDGDNVKTVFLSDLGGIFSAARTLVMSLSENVGKQEMVNILAQLIEDAASNDEELLYLFGMKSDATN